MIYPIAVIVIAALVVGVILWKVIPTFANLFAGLGAELPLPTRIVIAASNGLVRFMPFVSGRHRCGGFRVSHLLRLDERTHGSSTRSRSSCRCSVN